MKQPFFALPWPEAQKIVAACFTFRLGIPCFALSLEQKSKKKREEKSPLSLPGLSIQVQRTKQEHRLIPVFLLYFLCNISSSCSQHARACKGHDLTQQGCGLGRARMGWRWRPSAQACLPRLTYQTWDFFVDRQSNCSVNRPF
jgi:hypothetical protein